MVSALSWAATLGILGTYAFLGRTGRARPFHVANAVGACILAPVNLAAGVPAQAVLSAVFGVIGFKALVSRG